jgi:glycosidase
MGQEFGMLGGDFAGIEDIRDADTILTYERLKKWPLTPKRRWKIIKAAAPDNARTPMQWTNQKNAGFSDGEPWLKVNANASLINAETDATARDSISQYYKKLIMLRKTNAALTDGNFERIPGPEDVFVFKREYTGESTGESTGEQETGGAEILYIACSLSKNERTLFLPLSGTVLAGNYFTDETDDDILSNKDYVGSRVILSRLKPYEAVILRA